MLKWQNAFFVKGRIEQYRGGSVLDIIEVVGMHLNLNNFYNGKSDFLGAELFFYSGNERILKS